MIISKGAALGEVVTMKLTSGEEIVGKLVDESDSKVTIGRPLVLTAANGGIGMVPYLFTVDPDRSVGFSRGTIVILEPTDADAAKQYIKATTGIQLAA